MGSALPIACPPQGCTRRGPVQGFPGSTSWRVLGLGESSPEQRGQDGGAPLQGPHLPHNSRDPKPDTGSGQVAGDGEKPLIPLGCCSGTPGPRGRDARQPAAPGWTSCSVPGGIRKTALLPACQSWSVVPGNSFHVAKNVPIGRAWPWGRRETREAAGEWRTIAFPVICMS